MKPKPNTTCSYCGYTWYTKSKLKKVTCPSCGNKNKNPTMTIKELTKNTKQHLKYPSLYFRVSKGYLPKALRFSQNNIQKERGYTRTLKDCLESLERIAKNCNNIVMMYEDFVKHSFYFIMHRKSYSTKRL